MKKALMLLTLFGFVATLPAFSCKKKEKTTKVVKAKTDAKETKGYKIARGGKEL